jgi:hypothetical protein
MNCFELTLIKLNKNNTIKHYNPNKTTYNKKKKNQPTKTCEIKTYFESDNKII